MKVRLEGSRVKVYDEKGELVSERDATLEDVIRVLIEKLSKMVIEGELNLETRKLF
jgi:hypothetical protein